MDDVGLYGALKTVRELARPGQVISISEAIEILADCYQTADSAIKKAERGAAISSGRLEPSKGRLQ